MTRTLSRLWFCVLIHRHAWKPIPPEEMADRLSVAYLRGTRLALAVCGRCGKEP